MQKVSTLTGIIIILVAVVILFGGVFAYQYFATKKQNVLKAKEPNFLFEMSGDKKGGADITIKNKTTGELIQTIDLQDIILSIYKDLTVAQVVNNDNDINFDGYKDLQILTDIPADNPGVFDFYTYNPSTGKFDLDKNLGDVFGPTFDPKVKTITSESVGGCAGGIFETETFSFVNGNYALTQKEEGNCCPDTTMDDGGKLGVTVTNYSGESVFSTAQKVCPPQQ